MTSLTETETKVAECIGSWINFGLKIALACVIFKTIIK